MHAHGTGARKILMWIDFHFYEYGNIQTTNVVLVTGSQDPSHKLSVYKEEWAKPGQRVVAMYRK
jgi:hypothetical protein